MPESEPTRDAPRIEVQGRIDGILVRGCSLAAFLVPIKLSLTYCVLIPLLALYGYSLCREKALKTGLAAPLQKILAPLAFFLIAVGVSATTGISPRHSFNPTLSLFFFSLSLLLFATKARPISVLIALLSGQTIAALHSVLDGAFPNTLPSLFLGKVTESGQLAISIFIAVGLVWRTLSSDLILKSKQDLRLLTVVGFATTVVVSALGFRYDAGAFATPILFAALGWGVVAAIVTKKLVTRNANLTLYAWIAVAAMPLLTGALLVNLKRGPWLGVATGVAIFCAFFARKLLVVVIAMIAVTVAAFPSIQTRLADSYTDFTISGGRSTIWKIGVELCAQYPMGVGYRNSGILRSFSREIPEELDHFHNNLLNITAENGWLASMLFVWFVITAVRLCFTKPTEPLLVAIGCGIISWQLAGIVEYNAGDAEVLIMVWLLLGIAMKELERVTTSTASLSNPN